MAMDKGNRKWVWFFAIGVMVLTSIPYLFGYLLQGDEWFFSGFVFGVEDGNTYIAKILLGAKGEWLFRSPYTAYPQHGVLVFLPYLLLGKLISGAGLHEQAVGLFHLFRIGAGLLVIHAAYDLICVFIDKESLRRLALVLVSVGGGAGWFLSLVAPQGWEGWLPVDFFSPEAFGFLELYGIPHLALARAGLFWGVRYFLVHGVLVDHRNTGVWWKFPKEPTEVRHITMIVLWGIFTLLSQPITGLIYWLVLGIFMIGLSMSAVLHKDTYKQWHVPFRWVIWAGFIVLPFILYNLIFYQVDDYLKAWVTQSTIPSPPILHYVAVYHVFIPLGVLGCVAGLRRNWQKFSPVIAWFIAVWILLYLPFNFQRRLIEGSWMAMVILTVVAMDMIRGKFVRTFVMWIIGGASVLTSIFLLLGGILSVQQPASPIFLPVKQVEAFRWFAQNTKVNSIVLTGYESGNALPAYALVRVLYGHQPESKNWKELEPQIAKFYSGDKLAQNELIAEFLIDYIYYGEDEKQIYTNRLSGYERVFERGDYEIFRIQRGKE